MAAILIIGSGILIGYVSSKIFIKYVNDRHKEFTDNLEIEMIERNFDYLNDRDKEFILNLEIEMIERNFSYESREKVENLLKTERDKRKDYIVDINQDNTISN